MLFKEIIAVYSDGTHNYIYGKYKSLNVKVGDTHAYHYTS
jgi:hypothetical protein